MLRSSLLLLLLAVVCASAAWSAPRAQTDAPVHRALAAAWQLPSSQGGFHAQATTCGNLVCLASGADCTSTSVQSECIETEYKAYSGSTCTCTAITAAPALGSSCTRSSDTVCGPTDIRQCAQNISTLTYQCFGKKTVGDSCSSSQECAPPRACVAGVCSADLALGDACRGATNRVLGFCPLTAYCPPAASAVCTAKGDVGASCDDRTAPCLPNLMCEPGKMVCEAAQYAYIASGQYANASSQCGSGIRNETDGICLDYGNQKAVYLANYAGAACDTSDPYTQSQCGVLGTCACGRATTGGNIARCELAQDILLPSLFVTLALLPAPYDRAVCESIVPLPARLRSDSSYCAVSNGFVAAYFRFVCANYNAIYTVDSPDYQQCIQVYSFANICGFNSSTGASSSSSSSSSASGASGISGATGTIASTGSSRTSSGTNAAPARAAASVASVLVLLAAVVASLA